jgi:hypothetical protein
MPTKQLVVAISSTARDLPEHREEVMNACLQQGMFPKMMEHLPASPEDAIRASLEIVNKADIYLGVFAYRYGYIPAGHDISITEMEYDRAVEREIHRLIFIMHEDHPVKAADVEKGAGAVKLDALKERLKAEQVVNFFKSPMDLRALVVNSLSQLRRPSTEGGVVYEAAVVEMFSPTGSPIGAMMNRLEPYPGFPYFSAESDHPSQWPPRVFKDRTAFAQQMARELSGEAAAELARWRKESPPRMSFTGLAEDDPQFNYALLRSLLIESDGDHARVRETVGPHSEQALVKLEAARREIEEGLPNRLLILRVINQLDEDVERFTAEIRLKGSVYDVTLNAQDEETRGLEWTPNRFSLEIPLLRPGYTADIYVWYYTLPPEGMAFPGPMDMRWAVTEGVVIENLAASGVRIVKSDELLDTLAAYHRFPVDPVRNSTTFGRLEEEEEGQEEEESAQVEPDDRPSNLSVSRPDAPAPYTLLLSLQVTESYRQKNDAYEAQAILSNAVGKFRDALAGEVAGAGGFWIYELEAPVRSEYNSFGGGYYVTGQLLAVLRAEEFADLSKLAESSALPRPVRVGADFIPWDEAKYEVVLHFFTDDRDSRGDSKRLLTNRLSLAQIFDTEAARAGRRNVIAPEFANLLRYSCRRLTEHYGQPFTLEQASDGQAPFYVVVRGGNVGENFYLPKSWMKLAESSDELPADGGQLFSRLSRLYDYADHSRELSAAEFAQVFRQ